MILEYLDLSENRLTEQQKRECTELFQRLDGRLYGWGPLGPYMADFLVLRDDLMRQSNDLKRGLEDLKSKLELKAEQDLRKNQEALVGAAQVLSQEAAARIQAAENSMDSGPGFSTGKPVEMIKAEYGMRMAKDFLCSAEGYLRKAEDLLLTKTRDLRSYPV